MKLLKYNQGMTLIEVLIASIILFISVSALSFVMRSSSLHDLRLVKNIDKALLAEFIKDEVAYQYQYQNNLKGIYKINDKSYVWQVSVINERAPLRVISNEDNNSNNATQEGRVILYQIDVMSDGDNKYLLSVKDVFWQN